MATAILTEEERINAIEHLQPTQESKIIHYKGEDDLYFVYEIPLNYLVYNVHNGRIRSLTLSYESQYPELDPQQEEDKIIIEQFLYDSAKAKNDRTIESIRKNGQQEIGIITKDGVIIDGNRRAMILSMINKTPGENRKFKAIILKDKLKDNKKEIITLETSYQMGVDSKVDYNPIEKYIRCQELLTYYEIPEIAKKMAETESRIKEWLDILDLMEQYLTYFGTPSTFTRLEKREGHFVDLFKYLKAYQGKNTHQCVDWEFSSSDVEDMKKAYFSYIRLGIPVARARVIARPANSNSFFSHRTIWEEFKKEYTFVTNSVQEPNYEELKTKLENENNSVLLDKIDTNWRKKVEDSLENILSYYEAILVDKLNVFAPLKLLKRAKSTLFQIDQGVLKSEMDDEKWILINDLDRIIQTFKSL